MAAPWIRWIPKLRYLTEKIVSMKKLIIGAIVGGFLAFSWQTVSHTALDLHRNAEQHTARQDTVLAFLKGIGLEDGHYLMPRTPAGASDEDFMRFAEEIKGKPWARLSYHSEWNTDMTGNILRGLFASMLMAGLIVWIIMKMQYPSFGTILFTCLFVGMAGFIQFPYSVFIWYKTGDIRADLIDGVMMWGLCGVWLGIWLRRR